MCQRMSSAKYFCRALRSPRPKAALASRPRLSFGCVIGPSLGSTYRTKSAGRSAGRQGAGRDAPPLFGEAVRQLLAPDRPIRHAGRAACILVWVAAVRCGVWQGDWPVDLAEILRRSRRGAPKPPADRSGGRGGRAAQRVPLVVVQDAGLKVGDELFARQLGEIKAFPGVAEPDGNRHRAP